MISSCAGSGPSREAEQKTWNKRGDNLASTPRIAEHACTTMTVSTPWIQSGKQALWLGVSSRSNAHIVILPIGGFCYAIGARTVRIMSADKR